MQSNENVCLFQMCSKMFYQNASTINLRLANEIGHNAY